MRNDEVVSAWLNGREAKSHTGNLSSLNGMLYSYSLAIAYRMGGKIYILDYTAPDNFESQTTSCHVGLVKRMAKSARIMDPEKFYYRAYYNT